MLNSQKTDNVTGGQLPYTGTEATAQIRKYYDLVGQLQSIDARLLAYSKPMNDLTEEEIAKLVVCLPKDNREDERARIVALQDMAAREEFRPPIPLTMLQAGAELRQRLERTGTKSVRAVAEAVGVSETLFSKFLAKDPAKRRPLSLKASSLTKLSHSVLNISCHETITNEKSRVLLPQPFSGVIERLTWMDESRNKELVSMVAKKLSALRSKRKPEEWFFVNRFRERLWMLEDDPRPAWGPFLNRGVTKRAMSLAYSLRGNTGQRILSKDNTDIETSITLLCAMETGQALDFFSAEQFALHVPVFTQGQEQEKLVQSRPLLILTDLWFSSTDGERDVVLADLTHRLMEEDTWTPNI